ncbi:MAG: glycosyltransferase family 4 protein [Tepidisphaerales bacterium]
MTDRLHILHLTAGSDAGGLSRYIFDLSMAMRSAGHRVEVAGERGAWHWLFERSPLPWIDLPLKGGPVALMASATRLRKRFRREGMPDVLHCHYRRPTLVARLLRLLGVRVPILYTLHLSDLSLSWGARLLSDFGDHTHVASTESLHWMLEQARVPRQRVTLIPHGVPLEQFPVTTAETRRAARDRFGLLEDDRVGVYVGRLDQRHPKNCHWLLDIAAAWGERERPRLRLLLAGEGPDLPELQRRILRDGLSERVHLLGHQPPLPVYQAADLLLLPSGREGFSLVCAEALATGLPVLRTRTAGTTETVVEGVTGESTPIDRSAFVRAALGLLADPQRLAAMRPAAAAHARAHLGFDRQFADTVALYRRLAASPP